MKKEDRLKILLNQINNQKIQSNRFKGIIGQLKKLTNVSSSENEEEKLNLEENLAKEYKVGNYILSITPDSEDPNYLLIQIK